MLPPGTTVYSYTPNFNPIIGFYTVTASTNAYGWDLPEDHTPNDIDGKSLVIDGDFTPGEFYQISVDGLCENTSYEFSSWLKNILPSDDFCPERSIPVNVKFEIRDITNTTVLASGETGDIHGVLNPQWEQYALVFQTLPNQTAVILKMVNNSGGICGNDLAIDDIVFRTCGDKVTITDSLSNENIEICEDNLTFSAQLTATPDFSVFSSHFYQWQLSFDGENWFDVTGENNSTYNTPIIDRSTFYRVLVSEDEINLNNDSCNSSSEIYEVNVIPFPTPAGSNGDKALCDDSNTPISVSTFTENSLVNWYDAPTGGTLLRANSRTFVPNASGTYYAEVNSVFTSCPSVSRTAVTLTYLETPIVEDEFFSICPETSIVLNANVSNESIVSAYLWSDGSTGNQIEVSSPGMYTVDVSNNDCTVTKTIEVKLINSPVIENITNQDQDIIVNASLEDGNMEYSLDGFSYQSSHVFLNIENGLYTIYVKNRDCPAAATMEFLHFQIPQFFTPNNDGINDFFQLNGISFFPNHSVAIFDRFGNLLEQSGNTDFSWDGTFNGKLLPSDTYWYLINLDGKEITGAVTLKR